MSQAWGHKIRPLTEQEIEQQVTLGKNWFAWQIEHPREGKIPDEQRCIHYERKCRISAKCDNESTTMLTYRYITGRAGRASSAEKPICEHHAKKYMDDTESSTIH